MRPFIILALFCLSCRKDLPILKVINGKDVIELHIQDAVILFEPSDSGYIVCSDGFYLTVEEAQELIKILDEQGGD